MIVPLRKDAAFLEDVRSCAVPAVWWLGQSGFLLHWHGHYALIDPYLSDSLSRKYAATDKPHVRMTERVVDPGLLDFVMVVTSSHNHTDHLDAETLVPLRSVCPDLRMVIPEANRHFVASRLGCDLTWPVGLNDGESVTVGPFTFHAIAAAHEMLDRDSLGRHPYLGYVIEFGRKRIYHSGDCVLYEGLAEKLRPFQPDVALLPVNGSLPARRVAGNFWGREAAWLAKEIGAELTVPCHYDMFEFNTVTTEEFIEHAGKLGVSYRILQNGEGMEL